MQSPFTQRPIRTAPVSRALWVVALSIAALTLAPLRASSDPNAPSAPAEPTKAAKKELYEKQLVCTSRTPVGSRIPRKSCYTRAQADAQSANVKEEMRDLGRQADRNAGRSLY